MKKLSALLIAISFCILSAGNVLANDSQVDEVGRHAVWTNWFDENGNRLPDPITKMHEDRMEPERVSTESGNGSGRDANPKQFDFIQETKTYDYSKDRGNSA